MSIGRPADIETIIKIENITIPKDRTSPAGIQIGERIQNQDQLTAPVSFKIIKTAANTKLIGVRLMVVLVFSITISPFVIILLYRHQQ